jgi:hypothetical protein
LVPSIAEQYMIKLGKSTKIPQNQERKPKVREGKA